VSFLIQTIFKRLLLISGSLSEKGQEAKLFLNGNKQPPLIVNDLKHGDNADGGIAFWVDIGTERFFKDLKITKE